MEIVSHEVGENGIVFYIKGRFSDKPDDLWGHAIPKGLLEERQEAWDLPDDVDPLDVVFCESYHAPDEMPDNPFDGDYETKRAKVLSLVQKHSGKMQGDKVALSNACKLPPVESIKFRKRLRAEFQARRAEQTVATSPHTSRQAVDSQMKEIRLGYERRDEEIKAAEFVQEIVDKYRQAKVKNSDHLRRIKP